MPYIGRSLGDGVRARYIYAATSGQTTFSGNDSNGIALAYSDTLYMDVYQNGVLLKPVTDYASTTGTSVVLVTGASTDDVVEMIVYDSFAVADTVSAANGGSFGGNVSVTGTLAATTLTGNGSGITNAGTLTESSKITLDSSSHSVTGIPDGVREVHLLWNGLSTSSGGPGITIRVGTSSGLVTSGYNLQYAYIYDSNTVGRSSTSAGLEIGNWGAGIVMYGYASLYRTNGTDDLWNFHYFTSMFTDYAGQIFGTGSIDLSAPLDRIAMVCVNAGTFDAGTMQALYR